jgi:hypothetical protein
LPSPSYMIVEDGSGFTTSNAYWDVDSVASYLRNNGYLDWANYTQDQQARAIIRSTMYIEKRFKRKYRGIRQTVEQALGWPRIGAFDDDNFTIFGIPYQLQFALAEYAIRAARYGVLAPDPLRPTLPQDLSQPTPGVTYASNTFTATVNFAAADTVTIGTRVYSFVSSNPSLDGQVLVGGSLAASLLNLYNAVNDAGDIATGLFTGSSNFGSGDSIQIGQRTYNFVTVLTPENVTDISCQVLVGVNLAASLANLAGAINYVGIESGNFYVLSRDTNVTATVTSTTLLATANTNMNISNFETVTPTSVVLASQTNAGSWSSPTLVLTGGSGTNYYVLSADPNVSAAVTPTQLVVTATSPQGNTVATTKSTAAGSWAATALSGGLITQVTPALVVGPMRSHTERIGPLEEEQTFDGLSQRAAQDEHTTRAAQASIVNDYNLPEYPEADLWIEQIVRNSSTGNRLVRA